MTLERTRLALIAGGVISAIGALGAGAATYLIFRSRRTYFRPVFDAVERGEDPYTVAVECGNSLSTDLVWITGLALAALLVVGVSIVVAGTSMPAASR